MTRRSATNDRTRRSTPPGTLTNRGFTRIQNDRTKCNDEGNCKNLLFHTFYGSGIEPRASTQVAQFQEIAGM